MRFWLFSFWCGPLPWSMPDRVFFCCCCYYCYHCASNGLTIAVFYFRCYWCHLFWIECWPSSKSIWCIDIAPCPLNGHACFCYSFGHLFFSLPAHIKHIFPSCRFVATYWSEHINFLCGISIEDMLTIEHSKRFVVIGLCVYWIVFCRNKFYSFNMISILL